MSSIVARQHRFTVGQSPFAHNFLVLFRIVEPDPAESWLTESSPTN
jgi:hypothetical protein